MQRSETHGEGDLVNIESDHESSEASHAHEPEGLTTVREGNPSDEYRKTFILGGHSMSCSDLGNEFDDLCSLDDFGNVRALSSHATPAAESSEGLVESIKN